jgi:threonine dehydrogenase-like Zn-dependent dehydrogenase
MPTEGQVLLRITASGICGSDKWLWRAAEPVTRIGGHEVAGVVGEVGTGVKHLRSGDRVAVNNVVGCGRCPACRAGNFVLCQNWTGDQDVNGGFAELVAAPERNCILLPDDLDNESGCLIFDNFGAPFCALERGGAQPGDDVLVTGLGPIGLAAVILAKLRGAFVIAADPLPFRRELALHLGADAALEPGETLASQVREDRMAGGTVGYRMLG